MKGERRHELQTNELADFLAHGMDRYRQQLPSILWGGVAILAVIVAVMTWSSRSRSSESLAWEELDQVQNVDSKLRPKRLKELVAHYPDTEIALWARLDLADQLCFDGHEKMPLDREVAVTYLKEAQQTYAAVLQDPKARREMIRRAALAEPKCWELIGDRDKAIASYKSIAEKFKTTVPDVAAQAESRASELARPEAADFYKWLAEYKAPTIPSLNIPGLGPTFPPLGEDHGKRDSAPTAAPAANEDSAPKAATEPDPAADPQGAPEAPKKADPAENSNESK